MCVYFLCKTNCIKVMLVKYQYTHKNMTWESELSVCIFTVCRKLAFKLLLAIISVI